MTIDDAVKLLDAVTKLIALLVWPAILAFVLVRFRGALGDFMTSLSEFSLKGGGSKRRQSESRLRPPRLSVLRPWRIPTRARLPKT